MREARGELILPGGFAAVGTELYSIRNSRGVAVGSKGQG